MSEGDAEKAADKEKGKDNPEMWGFLKKIWDSVYSGPVTKTLAIVGFLLVVFFVLGGIPKVQVFNALQSRNVLVLGVLAIATSLAILAVPKFQGKIGRFDLIFSFLMPVIGIFSIAIVILSHFGVFALPKSDSLRADLDEVVIGLALASWCGFIPAYLTARLLKALPSDIQTQVGTLTDQQKVLLDAVGAESTRLLGAIPAKIDEEILRLKEAEVDLLNHLKESESQLVNHVEDATRSMLKGFDQVFARALMMIKDAQEELILINFAMNFGSPHRYNPEVVRKYAERNNGADFGRDVASFFAQLRGKIASLPSVQILTVSNEGAFNNFLKPLSERKGYEALLQAFPAEQAALNKTRAEIAAMIERESDDCADGDAPKCMLEIDSLPIQLLIAGQPRRGASPRYGCLVFMVGSEMLQTELEPGTEPAFYTELDDMVDVFKILAAALIQAARKNIRKERLKR
jgi:hypothetical protein